MNLRDSSSRLDRGEILFTDRSSVWKSVIWAGSSILMFAAIASSFHMTSPKDLGMGVVGLAFAALMAWGFVTGMFSLVFGRRLTATTRGLEYEGWFKTCYYRWDEIDRIDVNEFRGMQTLLICPTPSASCRGISSQGWTRTPYEIQHALEAIRDGDVRTPSAMAQIGLSRRGASPRFLGMLLVIVMAVVAWVATWSSLGRPSAIDLAVAAVVLAGTLGGFTLWFRSPPKDLHPPLLTTVQEWIVCGLGALTIIGLPLTIYDEFTRPPLSDRPTVTQTPPSTATHPNASPNPAGVRWIKRPEVRFNDYPFRASALGVSGSALVRCQVNAQGHPINCTATETPSGYGFGEAAIRIVERGRLSRPPPDDGETPTFSVTIPFMLSN